MLRSHVQGVYLHQLKIEKKTRFKVNQTSQQMLAGPVAVLNVVLDRDEVIKETQHFKQGLFSLTITAFRIKGSSLQHTVTQAQVDILSPHMQMRCGRSAMVSIVLECPKPDFSFYTRDFVREGIPGTFGFISTDFDSQRSLNHRVRTGFPSSFQYGKGKPKA